MSCEYCGVLGNYQLDIPIGTPISPGGVENHGNVSHSWNLQYIHNSGLDTRDSFGLDIGLRYLDVPFLAESDYSTGISNQVLSFMATSGQCNRLLSRPRNAIQPYFHLFMQSDSGAGIVTASTNEENREVLGTLYGPEASDSNLGAIASSTTTWGIEFTPRDALFQLSLGFRMSSIFGGDDNPINSLQISIFVLFSIAWNREYNHLPWRDDHVQELISVLFSDITRGLQDGFTSRILNNPQHNIDRFGFNFEGGESTSSLPYLQTISAGLGGFSLSRSRASFLNMGRLNPGIPIGTTLRGIITAGVANANPATGEQSPSGWAAAETMWLNALGDLVYMMFRIDTPRERSEMDENQLIQRAMSAAHINSAINIFVTLLGAIILSVDSQNVFGYATMLGGIQNDLGLNLGPAPNDPNVPYTRSRDIRLIPYSYYSGNGHSGHQVGIAQRFRSNFGTDYGEPFFESRILFAYDDDNAPLEVASSTGFLFHPSVFRAALGAELLLNISNDHGTIPGIGGMTELGLEFSTRGRIAIGLWLQARMAYTPTATNDPYRFSLSTGLDISIRREE